MLKNERLTEKYCSYILVKWLFLTVPRVCLQFVIVVFPDHTHYLFYLLMNKRIYKIFKVRKRAKVTNRYNQVPHLTLDTNGKLTISQLYVTNESQEASPLPAGSVRFCIYNVGQFNIQF